MRIDHKASTNDEHMKAESAGAGRSAAQFEDAVKDHRFVQALLRLRLSVADVARDLEERLRADDPKRKVRPRTVQSWYQPKNSPMLRPIPADAAGLLNAAPYNVPLSAWARIRHLKAR